MPPKQSVHLSEDAMNDLLIGLGTAEAEAHLNVCERCRGQMQEFRSDLEAFNQATLLWSEAQPAKKVNVSKTKRGHAIFPALGWALAALAVLLLRIPLINHGTFSPAGSSAAAVAGTQDTEAQIAQDNELLRSVDAALNTDEASPLSEYHLSNGPQVRGQARQESRHP